MNNFAVALYYSDDSKPVVFAEFSFSFDPFISEIFLLTNKRNYDFQLRRVSSGSSKKKKGGRQKESSFDKASRTEGTK